MINDASEREKAKNLSSLTTLPPPQQQNKTIKRFFSVNLCFSLFYDDIEIFIEKKGVGHLVNLLNFDISDLKLTDCLILNYSDSDRGKNKSLSEGLWVRFLT